MYFVARDTDRLGLRGLLPENLHHTFHSCTLFVLQLFSPHPLGPCLPFVAVDDGAEHLQNAETATFAPCRASPPFNDCHSPCLGRQFPAHDGLWESASKTAGDLLARLAVEHCVHEVRSARTRGLPLDDLTFCVWDSR